MAFNPDVANAVLASTPKPEPSSVPSDECRCGAGPNPEHPERCVKGHVLRANLLASYTGKRSVAFWREHAEARREITEAILADLGQTMTDAPRALLLAVDSIAQCQLVRDSAFARMVESGGPLSSSGKVRRAFGAWLSSVDRLERHLRLIGLERRSRPAPSLAEVMAQPMPVVPTEEPKE